ncbi:MAG: AAA family ATPase [Chloroflexi bacterium]|nr:AAA family ATPase [Chloroflexota bacterium]
MTTPLLKTKLYIPPPRPNLVSRPRLFQRLDEGLHTGRRLTLVSAPAGSGKTTLVSEWISRVSLPVAWLSLDEGDNDPARFLAYCIAALRTIEAEAGIKGSSVGATARAMLQPPQLPPLESLLTALINDIADLPVSLMLVLDDYHVITAQPIHQAIAFLLDHLPQNMHLVIITRTFPPLSLSRLRGRGQMSEIRADDLRFTLDEVNEFLNRVMRLGLPSEDVVALQTRTEGWITGLQLAALALQEDQDPTRARAFIAAFTGDDRFVSDYLVAEVLQRQPEVIHHFLRQTAILDRLTASLCDAVLGSENSQAMLERLEEGNVFLIPLDRRRQWYRYHRLFAEALRSTLTRDEQMRLHQRAARWFEAHGFTGQAIRHALAYASTSGDWDDAERLIRLAAEETIFEGGVSTARGWLDTLPEKRVRADGELATYKSWVLALTGDMALAETYASAAEALLRQTGSEKTPDVNLGKLLALRAFIALFAHQDYGEAIRLASDALRRLREDQAHWRIIALWAMAESQERTSNIAAAIATLRTARQVGRAQGSQFFAVTIALFLATALQIHGQRRQAVAVCQEAIAQYSDETGRPSPVVGSIFSQLGRLYYEANQLELARKYLDQGLTLSEQLALDNSIMASLGFSAPTLYAQGETEAALQALQRAYKLALQTGLADADWYLAGEVNIRLRQGDLAFAQRWAEMAGMSSGDTPQYVHIEQHLVYARLLLALERLSDARRWLDRLERFTRERGLFRWLITTHILQALAAQQCGEHLAAREYLSQALKRAAPEDYFRAFLDEDKRVVTLLPEVRHVAPQFVDRLLDFAGSPGPRVGIVASPLVEPLSGRELEVLALIAAGLSNREIAQRLCIAVGTVKRHLNNIYGKLGAHSRTQAIAIARNLRLL